MGVLRNGILGGVSNKVGGVVGYNSRGLDIVRSYSKPTNPNTDAQQFQRRMFQSVTSFLSAMWLPNIKVLWDSLQSGKTVTGWSRAIKVNLLPQSGQFSPSLLVPVMGNLIPVLFTTFTRTDGASSSTLETNDVTNLSSLVPQYAIGCMLAVNIKTRKVYYEDAQIGETTSLSLNIPKAESTADLAVFAWYSDRSRKACMTAVNLTAVA
jgi:hypothetical protein